MNYFLSGFLLCFVFISFSLFLLMISLFRKHLIRKIKDNIKIMKHRHILVIRMNRHVSKCNLDIILELSMSAIVRNCIDER